MKPYLRPPWRAGQSGNPSGKKRYRLNNDEFRKLLDRYAFMTREELQASAQNDETPVIELAIASIFANAIKHGDYARVAFILDRCLGRPMQAVDEPTEISDLHLKSNEELAKLAAERFPHLLQLKVAP